jgi:hypothetical protein
MGDPGTSAQEPERANDVAELSDPLATWWLHSEHAG